MLAGLLAFNSVGFLLIGIVGLFFPHLPAELVGFELQRTDAVIEMRAQYGGLFAVIGLYGLLGVFKPSRQDASLLLMMFVYLGLATGRLLGLALDTADSPGTGYSHGAVSFEVIMTISFIAALFSRRGSGVTDHS